MKAPAKLLMRNTAHDAERCNAHSDMLWRFACLARPQVNMTATLVPQDPLQSALSDSQAMRITSVGCPRASG
jgi:hypothetical protein